MASITRGEANTPEGINWFLTVGTSAFDPFEIGFRIFDITGGLPGTQIFPATAGDYETITTTGRAAAGHFYAYDNTAATGWTPSATASLGTHRIEWRWRDTAASSYQSGSEDFEIVAASTGSGDLYVTVADIRAAGVTGDPPSDDYILTQIQIWQAFIDRACRQWFQPRDLDIYFDGTDSDAIHTGVPIISVSEVRINMGVETDSGEVLDPKFYRAYTSRTYPDDRRNPRIKLVDEYQGQRDIFTAPLRSHRRKFRKGRQNQFVRGVFGFTEEDGSVPRMIQRALTKLVIEKLGRPLVQGDPSAGLVLPSSLRGLVEEEWTDGHKLKFGQYAGGFVSRRPGLSGITQDAEILDIIKLYRAPIGIASPANPSYP